MDPLKLAQLMCSRLCHDLITPVGAISTGLEIISENPDDIDAELMELTSHSAGNAAQRLVYYRAAFGYSGFNILNSPDKIEKLLRDYLATYKINLDWKCDIDFQSNPIKADIIYDYARIIVNLVGLMIECAPYGGDFILEISQVQGAESLCFSFVVSGDLVPMKSENKKALLGELAEEDVTPHSVQSYLTHSFLDLKGAELSINSTTAQSLALSFETENLDGQQFGSLF